MENHPTGPIARMPPSRAGRRRLLMALRALIPPACMLGSVGLAALSHARIPDRCVILGARRSCTLEPFCYRILLVQLQVVATSRGRACRLAGGSTPTADRQGLIQW